MSLISPFFRLKQYMSCTKSFVSILNIFRVKVYFIYKYIYIYILTCFDSEVYWLGIYSISARMRCEFKYAIPCTHLNQKNAKQSLQTQIFCSAENASYWDLFNVSQFSPKSYSENFYIDKYKHRSGIHRNVKWKKWR